MQAEKIIIEFNDLTAEQNEKLSQSIISVDFTNFITALSGQAEISFNWFSASFYSEIQSVFYKYSAVNVFITKNNITNTLIKGFCLREKIVIENSRVVFVVTIVANTHALYLQHIKPFDLFESVNYKSLIQSIIKNNNLEKTYDQIIFTSLEKEIDGQTYSSTGQTVYNYIEQILNDFNLKLFTSCYKSSLKDLQILHFYDSGTYIENITKDYNQILSNINVINIKADIDYSYFPDIVTVESDQGFDDNNFTTEKTIKTKNIRSLGFNKINERKNFILPEILFTKKIKNNSTDDDSSDYAIALLRDSVFNGLQLQVQVNSLFTDTFNSKYCWTLGKKIDIENDLIKTYLKNKFDIYLKNNDKYYFVINGVEYSYSEEGMKCTLTLSPNDLIYSN